MAVLACWAAPAVTGSLASQAVRMLIGSRVAGTCHRSCQASISKPERGDDLDDLAALDRPDGWRRRGTRPPHTQDHRTDEVVGASRIKTLGVATQLQLRRACGAR